MNVFKKIINILFTVAGILFILICADIIVNKNVKTSLESLSKADREALTQITDIVNLFEDEENDDIWNSDYNPYKGSFAVTHTYGVLKGTTYIISSEITEAESVSSKILMQRIDMGENYDGVNVYRLAACTPQTLSFYFGGGDSEMFSFGDNDIFAMKFSSSTVSYTSPDSLEENFVKSTFRNDVQTADFPDSEVEVTFSLDSENIALTGLQYRIIDEMREEEDAEKLKELIVEYVTVREYQMTENKELASQQSRIELADGCPQFVYYRVSDETGHGLTYFNKTKGDEISFYSAFYYICTGQYQSGTHDYFERAGCAYSGAALCEILDENHIIPDWRERLDSSTQDKVVAPYDLIKEYCINACQKYHNKNIGDIMDKYSYEEIKSIAGLMTENQTGTESE